jgi:hypothetical protein
MPPLTPGGLLRAARTPLGLLALTIVASLSLVLIAGEPGALASVFIMSAYSVLGPLACALGRRWCIDTLVSVYAFGVIYVGILQTKAVADMREGAMIFMMPMLIYPFAVPISGLLRLVLWWRARSA